MTNKEIRQKIEELAEEKYREFSSSLCPGTQKMIGVRIPLLRNLAKQIAKEDWKDYLDNARDDSFEEILLQGFVIGTSKMKVEEMQYYLEKFIPKIDNWSTCDTTVAGLKVTKKYQKEMWIFIQKYLKSTKEFELRFAIIMMLDYYITEEYIDIVLEKLNKIQNEGYYVKMAVAWAISTCFVKFPDKTMKLLQNNQIDDFTYNKSLQKIRESYRVDNEAKELIKTMKR